MDKSARKRRRAAIQAAATLGTEVWCIWEPALESLLPALDMAIESGQISETFAAPDNQYSRSAKVIGNLAIIPIVGVIRPQEDFYTRYLGGTACSTIRNDITTAINDPNIKRIAYVVDTPGGSAIGLAETSKLMFDARSKIETVAYNKGMAASAGYFLGSSGGQFVSSPSASTGSIGSVILHAEYSQYFESRGVKLQHIQFGKHKTDGSQYKPLDSQGRATLQHYVDSYGHQFVDAVARNRGITSAQVMRDYGQGRVFIAAEALAAGMIDKIQTLEQALGGTAPQQRADNVDETILDAVDIAATFAGGLASNFAMNPASATDFHLPAAVTFGGFQNQPTAPRSNSGVIKPVNEKLKAYLFAVGCVNSVDANDDVATAAMNAWFVARGIAVPKNSAGEIDPDKALAMMQASGKPADNAAADQVATSAAPNVAPNVLAAQSQERAEAREMSAAEYRARRDEIESAAALINTGRPQPLITEQQIRQAVDNESMSVADVHAGWRAQLESSETGRQVHPPSTDNGGPAGQIRVTGHGGDRFVADAVDCLFVRIASMNEKLQPALQLEQHQALRDKDFGRIGHQKLGQIALECLVQAGDRRFDAWSHPEQVALAALQQGDRDLVLFGTTLDGYSGISAGDGGAYNRPGHFPNLLSNLAKKILDATIRLSRVQYQRWAQRVMDTDDFKASSITAIGQFTTLDDVPDGDDYQELKMTEEYKGAIRVGRKGNVVKLTPVMVANNDLDAWTQALMSLGYAHENVVNSLCLDLLAGNVNLADGNPLFSPQHNNLVVGGGAPSKEQAQKMKLIHRKQTGVGTDEPIDSLPEAVLVPTDLEDPAKQTYYSMERLREVKAAETDQNLNVHRSDQLDVIVEPKLDKYSISEWYTFDRGIRSIIYQFMSGYGRGGRRSTWFDPNNGCRMYALEGRVGAAAVGFRGAAKNPGS